MIINLRFSYAIINLDTSYAIYHHLVLFCFGWMVLVFQDRVSPCSLGCLELALLTRLAINSESHLPLPAKC